jgi:tetratricopeptide (TPR) repeat protein
MDAYITQLETKKASTAAADWSAMFRGQDFIVRTLLGDKRSAEATKLAVALPGLFPEIASAYILAGYGLLLTRDGTEAAAQFEKAREVLQSRPDAPNTGFANADEDWYYLDQLVRRSLEWGRLNEAVTLARAIITLYPHIAGAHSSYGYALLLTGQKTLAADAFATALHLDPQEARAIEFRRYEDD